VTAPEPAGEIRIGTSGWSYPRGRGAWTGVFYPAAGSRGRRIDELAYYAERFDTVEVNSSFYRPPAPDTTRRWVRRTPPGFEFAVKLYQKFTHPEMFHETTGQDPWSLGRPDVDEFRRALDPLATAGKLGPLLAQFPPSFHASPAARDYLAWLLEAFADCRLAVELRHRSWSDEQPATLALLDRVGAAWVQIDEPKFRFSVRQDLQAHAPGLYYMRLHGRNAETWWRHDHPEDRYDYLYSSQELSPIAAAVAQAARQSRKLYVYLNNHFAAKAVANAVVLRQQVGQSTPGDFEPAFVDRYPDVAALVATSRSLL